MNDMNNTDSPPTPLHLDYLAPSAESCPYSRVFGGGGGSCRCSDPGGNLSFLDRLSVDCAKP
jgi:hypothetical protein